jgi:hypothetical protein
MVIFSRSGSQPVMRSPGGPPVGLCGPGLADALVVIGLSVYGAQCGRVTRQEPKTSSTGPFCASVQICDGGQSPSVCGQQRTPSSRTSYSTHEPGASPVIATTVHAASASSQIVASLPLT